VFGDSVKGHDHAIFEVVMDEAGMIIYMQSMDGVLGAETVFIC